MKTLYKIGLFILFEVWMYVCLSVPALLMYHDRAYLNNWFVVGVFALACVAVYRIWNSGSEFLIQKFHEIGE